jgi:hypothetical protein
MLFFRLSPLLITNNVRAENGKLCRTIRFATRFNTFSDRWKRNAISDGTTMDHLPCCATIYCLGGGDHTPDKGDEYLLFYSKGSEGEHHISPAFFDLQVYFPLGVFDDLWRMVSERHRVTFHGQIAREDLTETSHDPIRGGSTYEWNAKDSMKVIRSFSFRIANQYGPSDPLPSKLAEEYETKYGRHSQMTHLCLDIIGQTEREAERLGVEMQHTCPEDWPDVISDLEQFYLDRRNPNHWLWSHVDDVENFTEDRFNEDSAIELMNSLLNSPWLRCDELELAVVDYMIFWEAFGFSKQTEAALGSRWPSKATRAAGARLVEVGWRMRCAYSTLRTSRVFSPFQIRAALLHAQDAGAAWKPVVFAMLDRAATRDPPIWIVP